LKVAKWLLQINPEIDTSAGDDDAFCFACYNGHLDVAQWLYKIDTRITASICAFSWACRNGHLAVAQWLLEINPDVDISAMEEHAFRHTCKNGHLAVAQWLLRVKPETNVSACDEYAFCWASANGYLEMAQWLIQVNPAIDLTACNEEAFRCACANGHIAVVAWFCRLHPDKYLSTIQNNALISWKIKYVIEYEGTSITCNDDDDINCGICYDNVVELKSVVCGHMYCKTCILRMFEKHNNHCAFCRREFTRFMELKNFV
jgi:hypothetical protein